jgi:hypothetical protein
MNETEKSCLDIAVKFIRICYLLSWWAVQRKDKNMSWMNEEVQVIVATNAFFE